MKQLPEVFVDWNWMKTVNYILFKLNPNDELILKATDNSMFRMFMESVVKTLCEERKFYKKVGKVQKEGNEIKIHLIKMGADE